MTNNLGSNRVERKAFSTGGTACGWAKHPRSFAKRQTSKRARKAARLA